MKPYLFGLSLSPSGDARNTLGVLRYIQHRPHARGLWGQDLGMRSIAILLYRMLLVSMVLPAKCVSLSTYLVVFRGLSGDDASPTYLHGCLVLQLVYYTFMIDFYMKITIISIATCLACHYYKSHSAEGLAPMVLIIIICLWYACAWLYFSL